MGTVEIDNQWIRDMWRSNPFCHWSGLPLPEEDLQGMIYPVSLDRLDDHVGYTKSNTVLCLSPFNLMRANGTSHMIGSGMDPDQTYQYIRALKTGHFGSVHAHQPAYYYQPEIS